MNGKVIKGGGKSGAAAAVVEREWAPFFFSEK